MFLISPPQDSLTAAAEDPASPEVVLMEEGSTKEEPEADDAVDQLLPHKDGSTMLEIQPRTLKVMVESMCFFSAKTQS